MTCREAFIHLQTKSLLNKLFVYNFHNIYFPKTIPSKILYICSSLIHKQSKHLLLLASCFDPIIRKEHQYFRSPQNILAWKNSRHFATPPLVSPRNDVWEIQYWWRVTTQIWVVTCYQYGISAPVSQTSFGGETSGNVPKSRLFSHAKNISLWRGCHGRKTHSFPYKEQFNKSGKIHTIM